MQGFKRDPPNFLNHQVIIDASENINKWKYVYNLTRRENQNGRRTLQQEWLNLWPHTDADLTLRFPGCQCVEGAVHKIAEPQSPYL